MLVPLIDERHRFERVDSDATILAGDETLRVRAGVGTRSESIVDAIRTEEPALDDVTL